MPLDMAPGWGWRSIYKMIHVLILKFFLRFFDAHTVKPVLVAFPIKQATCIKQACTLYSFPKKGKLKCTCIKQAPVLSQYMLIIPLVLV